MSTFDSVRYYIALLLVVFGPGAALFWFPIHPFAAFWRRVGVGWAYLAGFGTYAAACLAGWALRAPLLSVEFGTGPIVIAAAVVLIAAAIVLRQLWRRQLSMHILFGMPELSSSQPQKILSEGAYAWVRHPRYVEVLVGSLGWAFLCNYLAAYVVWAFLAGTLAIVIPLEERELAQRFGAAYQEYRRRVPALIPRLRRGSQSG